MDKAPIKATRPEGLTARALGRKAERRRRAELLPVLEPADGAPAARVAETTEPRQTVEQALRLSHGSIREESTDFRRRSEARDPVAIATVYTINLCVMLFAFPLGFALLVFNILGGENLRTTSHVMGLTGLASTLPFLGLSVPFLT